jgi:hypothetical protein
MLALKAYGSSKPVREGVGSGWYWCCVGGIKLVSVGKALLVPVGVHAGYG